MSTASVVIHPSQFPEQVRRDLIQSLRTRRANHKFHYDSVKQTNRWLALHQAYSPSRNDDDCLAMYDRAFAEVVKQISAGRVHLIGLGCGGGQKDTRLLKRLNRRGVEMSYAPSDVSVAMTLVARRAALTVVAERNCFPIVCDLATVGNLAELFLTHQAPRTTRLITFFGMIPNFEPGEILPKLATLVRPRDFLLFSANLAPGADYAAGMEKILPQYDNELTREWLQTFLLDLGVERRGGEVRFGVETGTNRLRRIVADFHFKRRCRITVEGKAFTFQRGEPFRLFFSYRYTTDLVRSELGKRGLRVCEHWLARSGEEGVFLCRRERLKA